MIIANKINSLQSNYSIKTLPQLVFIVGRARSGTTLLQLILDSHPMLSVPPECGFIMNMLNKYAQLKLKDINIDKFIDDLLLEERFKSWNIHFETFYTMLNNLEKSCNFQQLCRSIYSVYAYSNDKYNVSYCCDNNHHYSLFVDKIAFNFPGAKFLHLVRDYRANILSHKNVKFESNNSCVLAHRWKSYHSAIRNSSTSKTENMIVIRYEDLVTKPENTLNQICSFLNISYDEIMLTHINLKRPEFSDPWHENLVHPVNTKRIDSWKHDLTMQDISISDYICKNEGIYYDYKPFIDSYSYSKALTNKVFISGIYSKFLTFLERFAFMLPITIRSFGIALYRRLNNTI